MPYFGDSFLFPGDFKGRMSFNFIPLHFVAKYLTSRLKFKWGWYLLFGGPLLAIAGMLLKNKALNNFAPGETNS
jgi:hypothetical protein